MITKKAFKEYCRKNNLRYEFKNEYYKGLLRSNWNDNLFCVLCCNGYIETLKWLLTLGEINIHANDEEAFIRSCSEGHFEVVKWLMKISEKSGKIINIHAKDEKAFKESCINGQQSNLLCKLLCFQNHLAFCTK